MPLLLRGLNLPDNEIRAGVIDTLIAATDPDSKDNELVSEYASSLVTVMLKNAKAKDMPSPVRDEDLGNDKMTNTCFVRLSELLLCDTSPSCQAWFDMIYCIPRRRRLLVSFLHAWTIRGG